jgi:CsoR family transcriptional regulator, copper-sensing transcriptional repressor
MTACWRSFVWFIATVTSGAVNSMPTSAVKVSGTPWTWPEPTTVTSRGLSPTFAAWLSQADTALTVRPNASTKRSASLAGVVMGMTSTLVVRGRTTRSCYTPPRVGWGIVPLMSEELTAKKQAVLNRLKTVRGHLDGIIRMVESDAYCVDVMKQVSAVQSSLERANRVMLHNHLETCFSAAVLDGRGQAAIDELVDAIKFTPALTGPLAQLSGAAVGEPADQLATASSS